MFSRVLSLRLAAVAGVVAIVAVAGTTSAPAQDGTGYDISYPQCGKPLPVGAAFGVVGVNGGRAFKPNPCLAEQLAWARRSTVGPPQLYANTGNPGPAYSTRWPVGQTSPRVCDAGAPNSSACSFDYGWNAAKDSFNNAVLAYQTVDGLDAASARDRAAAVKWWLDVEILNSWQTLEDAYGPTSTSKWNDVYALTGAIRALWDEDVAFVGIYSTTYQWNAITGGRAYTKDWFSANPVWLAGFSANTAANGCAASSFTGGRVAMTQYLSEGFDANYLC